MHQMEYLNLGGFFVIAEQVHKHDSQITFCAYKVFGWDEAQHQYTFCLFDAFRDSWCMPANGVWQGNTLIIFQEVCLGFARYAYTFTSDREARPVPVRAACPFGEAVPQAQDSALRASPERSSGSQSPIGWAHTGDRNDATSSGYYTLQIDFSADGTEWEPFFVGEFRRVQPKNCCFHEALNTSYLQLQIDFEEERVFMVDVSVPENSPQPTSAVTIEESLSQAIELVLAEDRQVLEKVNYEAAAQLAQAILAAKKIFVTGEGRSGLVIRMVAMRLMHLGLQVYVVGETTTPSIHSGDLLIACSGSGSTGNVAVIAAKAKEIGAQVVAVTTQAESPLGKEADILIPVEAAAKQDYSHHESQQFAGSLFEQSTLLLLDALFHVLSQNLGKDSETLWALHTNLE
jgi:6-phospho-3-hexuloisomerase